MSKKKEQAPILFELNPDKIEVALSVFERGRSFLFTHEFHRPTEKDWLEFDKALMVAVEDDNFYGGIRPVENSITAACALWDAIAERVTGHKLFLTNGWKNAIRPAHKKAAVERLMKVRVADLREDDPFDFGAIGEEETVRLWADRGEEFSDLIHRFRAPSIPQQIEYERLQADSVIVRGNKTGRDKIVIPARLAREIKFYDELIAGVEGYSLKDQPVTGRDDAIRWMDALHKRMAVRGLFSSGAIS